MEKALQMLSNQTTRQPAAKLTINAAHEDGKGDYGAEVAALAQAGGEILMVVGYLDQGGKGTIQSSLDAGAFSDFFLPDAMIGESLVKAIGPRSGWFYWDRARN